MRLKDDVNTHTILVGVHRPVTTNGTNWISTVALKETPQCILFLFIHCINILYYLLILVHLSRKLLIYWTYMLSCSLHQSVDNR